MKLYAIFSKESIALMGGNRGKMAAQAGHAYLHAFWDSEKRWRSYEGGLGGDYTSNADRYRDSGMATKVCLIVDTTEELANLYYKYEGKVGTTFVQDAGKTVFKGPTLTCVGIGPITEEECGEDLKTLKVFI